MMKKALPSLLLISLLGPISFFASAETELKGSPEELRNFLHPRENTVTLNAESEKTAYSDQAIISLVITTDEKKLADSISNNDKLRSTIRTNLNSAGISNDDINNSKFSSTPEYGWFGKKPDSYKVVNRMAITLNTEAQLKAVAELVDQFSEVSLADTVFKHTQKDAFTQSVKEEALNKIALQKDMYEKNLGLELTPVSFRDNSINTFATQGAMALEEVVVTARKKSKAASYAADSAPAPATSFDEIKYSAHISVVFKVIEPEN